jgi:mercuric ion transport protein
MRAQPEQLIVELVYDRGCPNVDQARERISAALREVGAPPSWSEWDRAGDATPASLRNFGSPTVLVNGQDVSGDQNAGAKADANSCRVYRDDCGRVCGAPSVMMIVSALNGGAR